MNPRRLWLLLGLVLLTALCGGCQDVGNRVVVEIYAGFAPETQLHEVEVTIAASATVEGDRICAPYSRFFTVGTADGTDVEFTTFPLKIAVKPGPVFNKVLYVRVRGWQWGNLKLQSEHMVSLQGGDVRLELLLRADCLGIGTGAGQHCVGGLAMRSPYGPIFDDNLHVAPDAPSCVVE